MRLLKNREVFFWSSLFLLVGLFFLKAFNIGFFADDFFLLKTSNAGSFGEVAEFFNPSKSYGFYRPISTEFFYFLINQFNKSSIIGHLVAFLTFFVGLVFLYRSLLEIFKNRLVPKLVVIFYSLSFIHVYQLYWLAAYQEMAMFTFLSISFFLFIKNKLLLSLVVFVFGLLSREQASLFPIFLSFFILVRASYFTKKRLLIIGAMLSLSFLFALFYKQNFQALALKPEYMIRLEPGLMGNNFLWYFLWSLGFPSILPDYFPSVFGPPLKEFWRYLNNPQFVIYLYSFLLFLILSTAGLVALLLDRTKRLPILKMAIFCMVCFAIFVLPITPIFHKWMLRLTIPLIFISLFEGYFISLLIAKKGLFRFLGAFLVCLYIFWNFFGVKFHEGSSTYLFENGIVKEVGEIFINNKSSIEKSGIIYFEDKTKIENGWEGSKKVKLTLADKSFLEYFFPNSGVKVEYGFETPRPKGAFVINAGSLVERGAANAN